MDLDQPLTTIGDTVVTLGGAALLVAGTVVVLLLVIAGLLIFSYRGQRSDTEGAARKTADLEMRLAELTGRLTTISESAAGRDAHLARTLDQRLDQISLRMGQNAQETDKAHVGKPASGL